MSLFTPPTLAVKRKRTEPAVDSLLVERSSGSTLKRAKIEEAQKPPKTHIFRLVHGPDTASPKPRDSPQPLASRTSYMQRFHAAGSGRIFKKIPSGTNEGTLARSSDAPLTGDSKTSGAGMGAIATPASRPQKRPGAGSTPVAPKLSSAKQQHSGPTPSDDIVRKFEQFSEAVEKEEAVPNPSTRSRRAYGDYKPNANVRRYKDRFPEKATAPPAADPDAMDVDTDDYVYDTYVREEVMPDADGKIPEPEGTVGVLIIGADDAEWWDEEIESEGGGGTDDEDENAEGYYANDYPEDELSSDDEYGREPHKYRRGSDGEGYDLENDDYDEVRSDDDEPSRPPKPLPTPGFWGSTGE
ncbi:hypothetical protein BDV95DRAFT_665725 [Massariosphaeria phaeospora]|uniref:Transcription factor Iwr1 domain-containing protein n=1 Tax=Massariosphaeria phaeospora TaxID=100035 RepID=A0A7C8IB03_9PLEO|nr:hypothetical protein BDV95DRAFT_665725 [Massariosphaeria phaeospora]